MLRKRRASAAPRVWNALEHVRPRCVSWPMWHARVFSLFFNYFLTISTPEGYSTKIWRSDARACIYLALALENATVPGPVQQVCGRRHRVLSIGTILAAYLCRDQHLLVKFRYCPRNTASFYILNMFQGKILLQEYYYFRKASRIGFPRLRTH